ncbi:hypothetical protein CBOM_03871 [Ceraceosorus bombacis]|uniref:Uncharacterized protein n=1 Tax=Ceraceosorus bombacis TaxID=401625 RepID=A0A0P1BIT2_9BASI|nr:hypothetical protein CBOM_03871 [Ceraceosorus bombacis]
MRLRPFSTPSTRHQEPIIYIANRPYVLRELDSPMQTYSISQRADNLEVIESRLKQDLLREASNWGGLVLVHEEDEQQSLTPSWVAVEPDTVHTVREVYEKAKAEGWAVDYHRIPIAASQSIEDNYLDAYVRILKELDPLRTSVVANCGIGAVRTTMAMATAVIIRRRQMMVLHGYDSLSIELHKHRSPHPNSHASAAHGRRPSAAGAANAGPQSMGDALARASAEHQYAQTLLRLMQLLANTVGSSSSFDSRTILDTLLGNPSLFDAFQRAFRGDYGIIRSLCGLLEKGIESKRVADITLDACGAVVNLREQILTERVAFAVAKHDPKKADLADVQRDALHVRGDHAAARLGRAVRTLEQYVSLVVFAEYSSGSETAAFTHRFSTYLKGRPEVWHTILRIRSKGAQLYLFDPLQDLSILGRPGAGLPMSKSQIMGGKSGLHRAVGAAVNGTSEQPGDEFADHIVRSRAGIVLRAGMLLKEDVWRNFLQRNVLLSRAAAGVGAVPGANLLRRVPETNIWVTGQPTTQGIAGTLRAIASQVAPDREARARSAVAVTWLNLREEPLCLINGKPVVLRQQGSSLRNVREFAGISWDRLTLLEDRLKTDCLAELELGEGKILLHHETDEGDVAPRWEETRAEDVQTLQEVMDSVAAQFESQEAGAVTLSYRRIPMTAERPPDLADFDAIVRLVVKADRECDAAIVLNDQLGRGRGTLAAVIVLLIKRWIDRHRRKDALAGSTRRADADSPQAQVQDGVSGLQAKALSYHVINTLLRIVPHGLEVKATVDECVDLCAQGGATAVNLREAIEHSRLQAEEAGETSKKGRSLLQSSIINLRRYYELCVFQAYLSASIPDTLDSLASFEHWIKRQPVLETLSAEFAKAAMHTVTPLQKLDNFEGMALQQEVQDVVANRNGGVLSAYTMLKSDMFPGLAKIALSQIEGMPNLRGVSLVLDASGDTPPRTPVSTAPTAAELRTWGHGMPSIEGLRKGLEHMGAGPLGCKRVVASSLREEPVLFIKGRPHVLRLADQPLTNVEATGITVNVVESMEASLKDDILLEIEKYNGRVLLHDELELEGGRFEIVPQWFSVSPLDVLTPREVYETVAAEGYRVDYARIPVTDEQAPVPAVFSQLESRVQLALRTDSSPAFNCQMGRGRTTTGLIIAVLVTTVSHYAEDLIAAESGSTFPSALFGQASGAEEGSDLPAQDGDDKLSLMDGAKDAMDNREDELWLAGEYRSAIDACDQVQNLRKAVYDAKLRAENADAGTIKHRHLSKVYNNYLQRYVFASYLLDKAHWAIEGDDQDDARSVVSRASTTVSAAAVISQATEARHFPSFLEWLKPRREISDILRKKLE